MALASTLGSLLGTWRPASKYFRSSPFRIRLSIRLRSASAAVTERNLIDPRSRLETYETLFCDNCSRKRVRLADFASGVSNSRRVSESISRLLR